MANAFDKRINAAKASGNFDAKVTTKATKKESITTVKTSVKTSYKVSPLTLRMSISDKKEIADWVDDLQRMTGRQVSAAKLFRALASYRDDIDDEALVKLIDKMN